VPSADELSPRVMPRRVLMVAGSLFPPVAAVGVLRILKHCKYLPELGWQPEVLAYRPRPGVDPIDETMLKQVRPDQIVHRTGSLDVRLLIDALRRAPLIRGRYSGASGPVQGDAPDAPGAGASRSLVTKLRALLINSPDRTIGWWPFGVCQGVGPARRCDCLYSSCPPFTAHLVALALHRLTGRPWIADFRDPWGENAWLTFAGDSHRRLHWWFEAATVHGARHVVAVTEEMTESLRRRYPREPGDKFVTIFNGFDEDDLLSDVPRLARSDRRRPLTVAYFGSLYGNRSPIPLFDAVKQLLASRRVPPDRIRIELIGSVADVVVRAAEARGLQRVVRFLPRLPREHALQRMCNTDLLLLIGAVDTDRYSVAVKTYEYLAARRPILALVPEGPIASIIHRYGVGTVAYPDRPDEIERALGHYLELHEREGLPQTCATQLDVFTRRRQAAQLAELLGRAANRGPGRSLSPNGRRV
jgi:hypothetical protein